MGGGKLSLSGAAPASGANGYQIDSRYPEQQVEQQNWNITADDATSERLRSTLTEMNKLMETGNTSALNEKMRYSFVIGSFPVIFTHTHLARSACLTDRPSISQLIRDYGLALHQSVGPLRGSQTACEVCFYLAIADPDCGRELMTKLKSSGLYETGNYKVLLWKADCYSTQHGSGLNVSDHSAREAADPQITQFHSQTGKSKSSPSEHLACIPPARTAKAAQPGLKSGLKQTPGTGFVPESAAGTDVSLLKSEKSQYQYTEAECKSAVLKYCSDDKTKQTLIEMNLSPDESFNYSVYELCETVALFSFYQDWVVNGVGWRKVCAVLESKEKAFKISDYVCSEQKCKAEIERYCSTEEKKLRLMRLDLSPRTTEQFSHDSLDYLPVKDRFEEYKLWVKTWVGQEDGWRKVYDVLREKDPRFVGGESKSESGSGLRTGSQPKVKPRSVEIGMFKLNLGDNPAGLSSESSHSARPKVVAPPVHSKSPDTFKAFSDEDYQRAITGCWSEIRLSINTEELIPFLSRNGFFNGENNNGLAILSNSVLSPMEKVEHALQMMKSDPRRYKVFYNSLTEEKEHSGHQSVLEKIDRSLTRPR